MKMRVKFRTTEYDEHNLKSTKKNDEKTARAMRNELITYTASSLDRVKMQQDSESERKRAEPRKGQEKVESVGGGRL